MSEDNSPGRCLANPLASAAFRRRQLPSSGVLTKLTLECQTLLSSIRRQRLQRSIWSGQVTISNMCDYSAASRWNNLAQTSVQTFLVWRKCVISDDFGILESFRLAFWLKSKNISTTVKPWNFGRYVHTTVRNTSWWLSSRNTRSNVQPIFLIYQIPTKLTTR